MWQPKGNMTWDYHLKSVPQNFSESIDVYDIDVLDASKDIIDDLHEAGKKVICYFSAGSYEDWRDDADKFNSVDLGEPLDGWKGERWLDIRSLNVRNIMTQRIELAKSKNCDAIDPDNIDGYDNDNGFNLTESDSIDFVKFLVKTGHSNGMSVGLKNGGSIVDDLVNDVDFSVQEQCVEYKECDLYEEFIDQGKTIFHIEYPKGDKSNSNPFTEKQIDKYCDSNMAKGFSSILKNMNLDYLLVECSSKFSEADVASSSDFISISSPTTSKEDSESSSENKGLLNERNFVLTTLAFAASFI
ncbi:hypothetical protein CLIB1444_09S05138 [[Candida] jaroonii]|uniref:Uncharacterized protein n=1 Tax=[Candida] jaroonii TaxID=467808 RepID=A0ACA9YCN8_9ASCO|nr:hypothetical protein CLIB1444_09S05138 [[Candida] jaroonii]